MTEKILLVDDDLDTLRLVGMMLQRQGFEVRAANSGAQALTMAQNDHPDLILLDVMMPEIDGYEVARRLRTDPLTTDIPIIMFTAKTQVDDKVMGFEAGADDYLTKPTQPRELFAHMRAVLARSGKNKPGVIPSPGDRGYSIGVISTKGGLGVTTLALNLGITLHEISNKDVIVGEYRPGQGSISLELGFLKPEGLNRLLQAKPGEIGADEVENELVMHSSGTRLLLASSQPRDAHFYSAVANFEVITRQLLYLTRFLILDLGAGITPVNEKVLKFCDEVMLVMEPSPASINQTRSMINDLAEIGIGEGRISIILINRVRSGVQLSWSQVQEQLGRSIAVIFTPAPELAYQASLHNLPIVLQQPDSLTAQQFTKLAERVSLRSRR